MDKEVNRRRRESHLRAWQSQVCTEIGKLDELALGHVAYEARDNGAEVSVSLDAFEAAEDLTRTTP